MRELAECAEKRRVEHAHASLALHRLDDHRRNSIRIHHPRQLANIPFSDRDSAGERTKGRAILWPVRRGERGEESAVKATAQGNDLVLAVTAGSTTPSPREFERTLIGLGARVAQEHARRERARDERLRQFSPWRRVKEIGRVQHAALERASRCIGNPCVVVTERADADAAREIEIASAVGIEQARAFPAHDLERNALVDGQERERLAFVFR